MTDSIYYCAKENNDCPRCNECERYINSDSYTSKTTLFKNACTDNNNRILFIKAEYVNEPNDNTEKEEDDSTEQTS